MSKMIQIRDVPDDVHRELRMRAAAAGMSLSRYLLEEITKIASHPPVAEVLRRAQERGGGASLDDVLRAIDEGRNRR